MVAGVSGTCVRYQLALLTETFSQGLICAGVLSVSRSLCCSTLLLSRSRAGAQPSVMSTKTCSREEHIDRCELLCLWCSLKGRARRSTYGHGQHCTNQTLQLQPSRKRMQNPNLTDKVSISPL